MSSLLKAISDVAEIWESSNLGFHNHLPVFFLFTWTPWFAASRGNNRNVVPHSDNCYSLAK